MKIYCHQETLLPKTQEIAATVGDLIQDQLKRYFKTKY